MIINQNLPALASYNALRATNSALGNSLQRLSTGLRINSASDDAAGLAISEKMRSQTRGVEQATRNAQDGSSMIGIAESALGEVHSILQRMRELSVQAANDTLTSSDRAYIQLEVEELKKEIDRISSTTQFNRKQLLDGSADALWSSSDLSTKALIKGSVPAEAAGNYLLLLEALQAGKAQIQKSSIMMERYVTDALVSIPDRHLTDFDMATGAVTSFDEIFHALFKGDESIEVVRVYPSPATTVDANNFQSAATFSGMGDIGLDTGIVLSTGSAQALIGPNVAAGTTTGGTGVSGDADLTALSGVNMNDVCRLEFDIKVDESTSALMFEYVFASEEYLEYVGGGVNDSFGFFVNGENVALAPDPNDPHKPGSSVTINTINDKVNSDYFIHNAPAQCNIIFDGYTVVLTAVVPVIPGSVNNIKLAIGDGGDSILDSSVLLSMRPLHSDFQYGVKPADPESAVGELVNMQGVEFPSTITVSQGDGTTASTTIYADDTMADIQSKLNDLIANGLGQAKYSANGAGNFVSFVDGNPTMEMTASNLGDGDYAIHYQSVHFDYLYGENQGIESVPGTFIIHSIVPGAAGKLYFSGNGDMLHLLGLNTIQESEESIFSLSISDAHSGATITNDVKISGNKAESALAPNVDVLFDPLADIEAAWNDKLKKFDLRTKASSYATILHIVGKSTTLQVGANEKEELTLSFGNMSSTALGLDGILMLDRELAAKSIGKIDSAIGVASAARARLGAYQNRLEHTVANLTTGGTNMRVAESRIRDADIAKEMMSFTKLNILSQAGNSMLAQANQLPQNVLPLLQQK